MNTTIPLRSNDDESRPRAVLMSNIASVGPVFMPAMGRHSAPERKNAEAKKVESAVYAYIQAIRALGKTRVDTAQIARALDLSSDQVEATIGALKKKGVKRL